MVNIDNSMFRNLNKIFTINPTYNEPAHQERSFDISHIRLHETVAY
ncbi:hypothetical protein [Streptococcus constellatus]|nr:hypothetical protein [Streptococcus constellatus]MDK6972579.1 hypothetical protein [Streptococcus constellatus]